VNIWDRDLTGSGERSDDQVDEFDFVFNDTAGSATRYIEEFSVRQEPKSR